MTSILHLSDLHLGPVRDEDIPDDYKSDIVPLAQRQSRFTMLKETLSQIHAVLGNRPLDAVIVSGDITVQNDPRGFQMLKNVLDSLGDARPANDRIVIVPGNHDVKWEDPG